MVHILFDISLSKDLSKHTTTSHVDYDSLFLALEKIKEVAEYINESKRIAESETKIQMIQSNILGDCEVLKGWIIIA